MKEQIIKLYKRNGKIRTGEYDNKPFKFISIQLNDNKNFAITLNKYLNDNKIDSAIVKDKALFNIRIYTIEDCDKFLELIN